MLQCVERIALMSVCVCVFRYVAVCHPHTFRQAQVGGGGTRVSLTTCLVFVAAIIINVPKVGTSFSTFLFLNDWFTTFQNYWCCTVKGATDTLYTVAVHSFNKNTGLYRQKTITISFYLVIGHSNIRTYFLHNTVHFFLFSLRQRLIVEFLNFLAVYKIKGSKGANMYPT